jgi:hypothetical protein
MACVGGPSPMSGLALWPCGDCECYTLQLSRESLMQRMASLKTNAAGVVAASITGAASGSGVGGVGISSSVRRRSRKASSIAMGGNSRPAWAAQPLSALQTVGMGTIGADEDLGGARHSSDLTVSGAASSASIQGVVTASAPSPASVCSFPWFKRLSVHSLMLAVDYNVRYLFPCGLTARSHVSLVLALVPGLWPLDHSDSPTLPC